MYSVKKVGLSSVVPRVVIEYCCFVHRDNVLCYRRIRRTLRTPRNICLSTWSETSRPTCSLTSSRRSRTSTGGALLLVTSSRLCLKLHVDATLIPSFSKIYFTFSTVDICRARWPGTLVMHAKEARWRYC